jgi:hypothetical protein
MIETLFALSWLGWTVFGILFIALIALVANELWGWTTFLVLVTAAAVWFFFPAVMLLLANPWNVLWYGLIYVAIGVVWSFIKWFFHVLNARDDYKKDLQRNSRDVKIDNYIPKAADCKATIIGWMAYWPWSAVWTVIDDPIRRMYKMLANLLGSTFDGIAKAMFKV